MKSSVHFPKTPWIIAFLLPILTFAYGSFRNFPIFFFLITILILLSSIFLFLPLSKHKVQVIKKDDHDNDIICYDQKISTQVEDEEKIKFSDEGSPESWSENEIIGRFSSTSEEDSDFDYPGCSDEESLIEIELPAGKYVGSPEAIYRWSEVNEEENLIEIDISMGSIK